MARRPTFGWIAGLGMCGLALTAGSTALGAKPHFPIQFGSVGNTELKPETLAAFQQYQARIEERIQRELAGRGPFLAIDALAPAEREAAYAALQRGETRIEQVQGNGGRGTIDCPGGMIHHWIGTVFIRGANLQRALRLMQDYDHQAQVYAPDVMSARLISHRGDDYKVFMRLRRQSVITVTLDTEHDVHYTRLDANRAAVRSVSTSVREVANAGKADEHDLPADTGGGYLWRINAYWRLLQRDGGVYVQCESISLTRDIPTGLGWIIGPFVTRHSEGVAGVYAGCHAEGAGGELSAVDSSKL